MKNEEVNCLVHTKKRFDFIMDKDDIKVGDFLYDPRTRYCDHDYWELYQVKYVDDDGFYAKSYLIFKDEKTKKDYQTSNMPMTDCGGFIWREVYDKKKKEFYIYLTHLSKNDAVLELIL